MHPDGLFFCCPHAVFFAQCLDSPISGCYNETNLRVNIHTEKRKKMRNVFAYAFYYFYFYYIVKK